jgi:hypothetical protein
MFSTFVGAGAVGARAATRYGFGSGSDQMVWLLAALAPQTSLPTHIKGIVSQDLMRIKRPADGCIR